MQAKGWTLQDDTFVCLKSTRLGTGVWGNRGRGVSILDGEVMRYSSRCVEVRQNRVT